MELKQVVRIVRRWWWLGLLPMVVVAGYLIATFQRPATAYQVVLRFMTGTEPADELSSDHDRYYAWLASEYVANGLADFAVTGEFSKAVAARLADDGLAIPAHAIQGSLITDNAQSVMVVYLVWPDAAQAVIIAEAVGAELLASGPEVYPQMDGVGTVARLADVPVAVPLPASLRAQLLQPAIRLLIAAAVGAGLMLTAYTFDPRLHDLADLEETGLHVLATVPRSRRP